MADVVSRIELFEDAMYKGYGPSSGDPSDYQGYTGTYHYWRDNPLDNAQLAPGANDARIELPLAGCERQHFRRVWKVLDQGSNTVEQVFSMPPDMAKEAAKQLGRQQEQHHDGAAQHYVHTRQPMDPSLDWFAADQSAWRDQDASQLQTSKRLLATASGDGVAMVPAALPAPGSQANWMFEVILKDTQQPSVVRTSVSMFYRQDACSLLCYVQERHITLPEDQLEAPLDPADVAMAAWLDPLRLPVDEYMSRQCQPEGTFTRLTYKPSGPLQREQGTTTCNNRRAGPLAVEAVLPNGGYVRVPARISPATQAAGAGGIVTFEFGNLLRDGGVARGLVEYEAGGRQLLHAASFEQYDPR